MYDIFIYHSITEVHITEMNCMNRIPVNIRFASAEITHSGWQSEYDTVYWCLYAPGVIVIYSETDTSSENQLEHKTC